MSTTDEFKHRKAVRTLAITGVTLWTGLSAAVQLAQGLDQAAASHLARQMERNEALRLAEVESKRPSERMELIYHKVVKEEIRRPTKPGEDYAPPPYDVHEYQLTQLAHRLAGVALEAKEAQTRLRDLLAAEKHQQAKEVLYLALGWSGDDAVWRDLVAIIKQKGRPLLRACAANALRDCNARLAIPDLLEALKDPEFADEDVPTHPDSPPHGAETVKQPVFRVRGGAAMALEKFGVKIRVPDKTKPYEFEVDKGSAVKAITPELHSKDKNHALQTIEAIARIGGEPARAELRKFVAQYQRDTKKADAVARAKQAISNLGRGN